MKGHIHLVCIIIATLLALCSCDRTRQHIDVDRSVYPVKGIDVSSHNGLVDFEAAKGDSVVFVYIKATEGSDFCDAFFARNFDNARAAGLKVGAYHFFRFDAPGHQQAYHFLSSINGREPDLPLVIDVEDWTNAESVPYEDILAELGNMVSVLENSGHAVMIYTNRRGYEKYIKNNYDSLPLWICSFGDISAFAPNWTLWQHSHKGRVAGIKGDVDINTFNGTPSAFQEFSTRDISSDTSTDSSLDASSDPSSDDPETYPI